MKDESGLSKAAPEIAKLLDSYTTRVFTPVQIERILSECKVILQLNQSITKNQFIDFLLKNKIIKAVKFDFPSQPIIRYKRGRISIYEMVQSLKPKSYFTHCSALKLHKLTVKNIETIYLNCEQPPKYHSNISLDQSRIEAAFKRPMRVSQNVARYKKYNICILNGMHTGGLGVTQTMHSGAMINVTNIEKTLIDIVVRPGYSGGVSEVLSAFRLAKNMFSVNDLVNMLEKLNYAYPYHQAIGFYMDHSGCYDDTSLNLLRSKGLKYDFYLTYDMREVKYSTKWRLFFPNNY
jgi:hypothetical protein